jgi:hypothetical protein
LSRSHKRSAAIYRQFLLHCCHAHSIVTYS